MCCHQCLQVRRKCFKSANEWNLENPRNFLLLTLEIDYKIQYIVNTSNEVLGWEGVWPDHDLGLSNYCGDPGKQDCTR